MNQDVDLSPVAFGTDGWRARLDTFTVPRVRAVGQAVASYLRDEGPDAPVAIGYDAREHSREFAEELARVLAANGFDVLVPDRDTPTPVVAWTVVDRGLAGALMVTASHNPPEYNGVKFIPADGAPALPEVTDDIESRLTPADPLPESEHGDVTEADFLEPYFEHALDRIDADLSGLTVAYDAMHGSGRGVTDELLDRAGATVIRRRCERDPEFGGESPEPSAEKLSDLVELVEHGDAALGVANDGDADRIGVVTPSGYLDANYLFAVLYDALLESESGPAIRTVSTTFLVDRVAAAHGEHAEETPVGFKWVAAGMKEHDALLGGEESGGFGLRDHVRNKDGVLVALLAAAAESEVPLDERLDGVLAEHGEIHQDRVSVDCPDERKVPVLDALEDEIPHAVDGVPVERVNSVDGFKLLLEDGTWLLVRPSGTEPKLRVYAEAGSEARVAALLDYGRALVEPLV